MNFAESLRDRLPRDVFTDSDLKLTFPTHTPNAIHKGISRSLASSEIVKLKRGLYMFGPRLRRQSVREFTIANQMYAPSYVSFESALSYHGLIPEAVYMITSTCPLRKKKTFRTPLGDFSFDFVPCKPFFLGVEYIRKPPHAFLIANPIRALFDFIYVRKKKYRSYEDAALDLRLDSEELGKAAQNFSVKELGELARSFKTKAVVDFFQIMIGEFK